MNTAAIDQALAELKQDRERIDRVIEGLNVVSDFYSRRAGGGVPPLPPPADPPAAQRPARKATVVRKTAVKKAPAPRKSAAGSPSCDKHPGSREFTPKGKCRICARDYMRDWYSKKTKGKTVKVDAQSAARKLATPAPAAPVGIALRCPSCPETFSNARELGRHQSREHYGSSSSMGSSLGQL